MEITKLDRKSHLPQTVSRLSVSWELLCESMAPLKGLLKIMMLDKANEITGVRDHEKH